MIILTFRLKEQEQYLRQKIGHVVLKKIYK